MSRAWGRKANTTSRGYGSAHQAVRRSWAPQVAAGLVDCWRCGERIRPGTPWDLGHDDHDRAVYRGPEHRGCNRATQTAARRADPPARPATKW